jgi:hypothetical protein
MPGKNFVRHQHFYCKKREKLYDIYGTLRITWGLSHFTESWRQFSWRIFFVCALILARGGSADCSVDTACHDFPASFAEKFTL